MALPSSDLAPAAIFEYQSAARTRATPHATPQAQANLQTQQQRPSKWHVAQKRALVGDLTVYSSTTPPYISCTASAQRRAWHSGRICPPPCRNLRFRAFNHTIQVFEIVSVLWVSCQCSGWKRVGDLSRMSCVVNPGCVVKPSSFIFTTAPFSISFPFYYSTIFNFFSFLLQHHFLFLFLFTTE